MTGETDRNGSDRDARGQFKKGNPGGPGNPDWKKASKYKSALKQAVSVQDLVDVFKALVKLAKGGDIDAIRLLSAYAIGKPQEDGKLDLVDVNLAAIRNEADAVEANAKILQAAGAGELSDTRAAALMALLGKSLEFVHEARREERVKANEEKQKEEEERRKARFGYFEQ